jgi:transposase
MHVAKVLSRAKGKTYVSYLLRRTYREGGKVKHQTLGNLSHLPGRVIEMVREALRGVVFVAAATALSIVRSLPHGHVEAVLGLIRRLGLDRIVGSVPTRERNLVLAMVAQRILEPSSKLAATRLFRTTTLGSELSVEGATEDELYRAMDWLLARQKRIENRLAARHLEEGCLVLYDLTSSTYYGRKCSLARLGRNKDGKKNTPCIAYGLLTDAAGRPIAIEAYPGNTADSVTLMEQIRKLQNRFHLERVVIVGDRGIVTDAEIEKLKVIPDVGWISALRSPAIRKLRDSGHLQMSLFDIQNVAEITSPDYPGERLVACFNPLLREERRRKREDLLNATESGLERLSREVARRSRKLLTKAEIGLKAGRVLYRFKMGKHFLLIIEDGRFQWRRRTDSIKRESLLDGIYVLRTSEPLKKLSACETVISYKRLTHVERAFRSLKSIDLLVRPIHHRLNDRVRAHLLICMLAYYVEWHMRKALAPLLYDDEDVDHLERLADPVAPARLSPHAAAKKASGRANNGTPLHSFRTLLAEVKTRCRNTCLIKTDPKETEITLLTEPTSLQSKVFQLLDL